MQQKRLLAARISKKKKEELSAFALMEKFMSQWHDNSIVTIASNWENHQPVHKTRRRV